MKTTILGLLFGLFPFLGFCQSIQEHLDKGEKVMLEITPQGDLFTDPAWFHSYEFVKSNSDYIVILTKDKKVIKKTLSKKELKPFIDYIKKWNKKSSYISQSYDSIVLKIGTTEKRFSAIRNSDAKLMDIMYKDRPAESMK